MSNKEQNAKLFRVGIGFWVIAGILAMVGVFTDSPSYLWSAVATWLVGVLIFIKIAYIRK